MSEVDTLMCISLPDDEEVDLKQSMKAEALVEVDKALVPEEKGHDQELGDGVGRWLGGALSTGIFGCNCSGQ